MPWTRSLPVFRGLAALDGARSGPGSAYRADRYAGLQNVLVESPERGDIIKGGGEIRKLRHALPRRGKSSGVRAIYYWLRDDHQIYRC